MAVNTQDLINDLQPYGVVGFCGVNNPKSYVVVLNNVITDEITLKNIVEGYVLTDYPNINTMTLVDGRFKIEYLI